MISSKEGPIHRVDYVQHQPRQGVHSRISPSFGYKHHHHGPLPVVELRVPMCCEKCREKVQEELEGLEGVRSVVCDQFHQRVTVAGYVDPLRVLKKVKKVKKKSEFFTEGSYINKTASPIVHAPGHAAVRHIGQPLLHRDTVTYTGQPAVHRNSVRYADQVSAHRDSVHYAGQISGHRDSVRYAGQPMVHGGSGLTPRLTRTNSFERGLSRQPSFGKVTHYDDLTHPQFETRDLQRDYYGGIRRMPSFKKHRYHDAEYVSMGDEFVPQYGETHYVGSERPMLQSQVSFSKLPVRNPHYVKPAYHEY